MPRVSEIRATFHGYKLPDGRVLNADFTVQLRLRKGPRYSYRYIPVMLPAGLSFGVTFAESKLDEAQALVAKQFEKQLTPWA